MSTETYDEVVRTERETCSACPLQVEGMLSGFRGFFFHYRHGWASLSVDGRTAGREVRNDEDPIADGCLSREQYERVFMELLSEITSSEDTEG